MKTDKLVSMDWVYVLISKSIEPLLRFSTWLSTGKYILLYTVHNSRSGNYIFGFESTYSLCICSAYIHARGASDGVCIAAGVLAGLNDRTCSDHLPGRQMTVEQTTLFRWRPNHGT